MQIAGCFRGHIHQGIIELETFFNFYLYLLFVVDGSESSGGDFYLNDNLETLKSSQV